MLGYPRVSVRSGVIGSQFAYSALPELIVSSILYKAFLAGELGYGAARRESENIGQPRTTAGGNGCLWDEAPTVARVLLRHTS